MILEVKDVSKHFGGIQALDHVSFTIRKGSINSLIGPNGAGKTTLINVVTGIYASHGEILFRGEDIAGLPAYVVASKGIGRTFQLEELFPSLSVLENAMVGCHVHTHSGMLSCGFALPSSRREERAIRDAAMESLKVVGLEGRANDPVSKLPLGERKLVGVARALAMNPAFLMLDEPVGGLAAHETHKLVDLIHSLASKGLTIFIVEHNMPFVMSLSEKVIVLDEGTKIAEGPPDEVRTNDEVIKAYLGEEVSRTDDVPTTTTERTGVPRLRAEGICTFYGEAQALKDISIEVNAKEVVAILGSNGAGKTTLLKTVNGLLAPREGRIFFEGSSIEGWLPHEIIKIGIASVAEGRELFGPMTVRDNLLLGTYSLTSSIRREEITRRLEMVFTLFPILKERLKQKAETMSGGQQQMLALGRALMAMPRLLALDEPSLGLSPLLVAEMMRTLKMICHTLEVSILLVEQNARAALEIADYVYVLERGEVVLQGACKDVIESPTIQSAYLGGSAEVCSKKTVST
jgi:branched-chain amino acid transport system permease protein